MCTIWSNRLCFRWWEELGLAKQLRFARDQPLKWYLWTVATLGDRSLSEHRIELTKPISLVYIIDDLFDVYGTLDQLTLFTDAVAKYAKKFYVHAYCFHHDIQLDKFMNISMSLSPYFADGKLQPQKNYQTTSRYVSKHSMTQPTI